MEQEQDVDVHIAGILVYARPELIERVQENIQSLDGAEVLTATQSGKIVVTLESETSAGIVEALAAIGDVYGVLSTALVYEHHEASDIRIDHDFGAGAAQIQ
ncbi:MAG TPA: chaperone NapD [Burkholderiales bacterium]